MNGDEVCIICGADDEILHEMSDGLYCVGCCPKCEAEREAEGTR